MQALVLWTTALCSHALIVHAQDCYYPDGSLAVDASPCQTNDGICCPYDWACLSNGLCHLDSEDLYGRYSCTAENWLSGACPTFCTNNMTASDDEAVLQCADDTYCCDGDRSFNCCNFTDTALFSLPFGQAYAYITKTPATATSTNSLSLTLSTVQLGNSITTPPSAATSSPLSAITVDHTITVVSTLPASTSTPGSSSDHSHHLKKSTIIGLAVGLPLGFLLLAAAIYCCCFRRYPDYETDPPPPEGLIPRSAGFVPPTLRPDPSYAPSELDGTTIRPPLSELDDTSVRQAPSELDASSVRHSYASSLRYSSFGSAMLVETSPHGGLYSTASRHSTLTMAAIAMPSVNEEPAELAGDEVLVENASAPVTAAPAAEQVTVEQTPQHDENIIVAPIPVRRILAPPNIFGEVGYRTPTPP